MNGWFRLGIVLTVLWTIVVTSYATYEFYTFPMQPFVDYVGPADPDYIERAKKFYFIKVVTKSGNDLLSSYEIAEFDKKIKEAKTDEEKAHLIEVKNVPESSSGLDKSFFIFLFGTIIMFWIFSYAFIAAAKWIAKGFKSAGVGG